MFAIMYEPVRSMGSCITEGGLAHAVNTSYIEDIFFYGDRAKVVLVSGDKFDTTRHEATFLLDELDKWGGDASKAIAEMEDAGRSYEKAKNDVANLKGGDAG